MTIGTTIGGTCNKKNNMNENNDSREKRSRGQNSVQKTGNHFQNVGNDFLNSDGSITQRVLSVSLSIVGYTAKQRKNEYKETETSVKTSRYLGRKYAR